MAWTDAAQAATLDLDHRAVPHEAIIKRITTRFVCRERPVRRCLACLDLIRGEDAGSTAQVELLEARFIGYGGSDAYRRRLRRLLGTYLRSVQGSDAQDPKQVHWERLAQLLAKLLVVESLPLHGHELGHWAGRPREPTWRIGGADVRRDDAGLAVLFDAEREEGWDQLRQHFPGDDLWPAIETCRAAIVRDLHARLALFREIRKGVKRPTSIGGVGLKVLDENEAAASSESVVTVAYVFEILDVLLSRARGMEGSFRGVLNCALSHPVSCTSVHIWEFTPSGAPIAPRPDAGSRGRLPHSAGWRKSKGRRAWQRRSIDADKTRSMR